MSKESTIDSARDWNDFGISPTTAAAKAIERLLISKPQSYTNSERLGYINGTSRVFIIAYIYSCSHIILLQTCGN
jgi:hypothetical protein